MVATMRKPPFWMRWRRWRAAAAFVDALFRARFKASIKAGLVDASAADQ
ncbi:MULTISPECIES: hypothetical protein [Bradyrhizobium]|jgi:hypothetical protein|uniref:Uncharacterized protein n=1 Tax=Bradyrhizobium elkanii TaxID=29448 RepID=A0ABV4ESD6_BRAEL|nr:hypothetical protein [Bradyrhizobium elkanii]MBP2429688.1 hypothetical protein [Bradyrhizobium elkanii]MCP1736841.1 hypothetical protein [Bradyrhizobium elkanii]MCP1754886.1 hypothetical protein [Bradyrhizobium elkanii]MCP1980404.1 hypothetical protein [Bradyrhizobium elkanii]MCS3572181.1 hypothetical protein [Bradyrhizobium elkanii]